ncbi:MAG: hypothetical protein JWQ44_2571 [Chthoniobacter sp.]|nr:hypothetical protein [Chthoniobacter sp.]
MRPIRHPRHRVVWVLALVAAGLQLQAHEPETLSEIRSSESTDVTPSLPGASTPQLDGITLFPDGLDLERSLLEFHDRRLWKLFFHGYARATYSDNIFIQHENAEEDLIFKIAPGITVGYGDLHRGAFDLKTFREGSETSRSEIPEEMNFLFVRYVPSYTAFLDHTSENTLDHDAALEGSYQRQKLKAGVKLHFQTLNLPEIDLGERIKQKRFTGQVTTEYDYSDKSTLELNGHAFTRDYDEQVHINEYRAQTWLNHLVHPKTNVSAGLTYGRVDVSSGPGENYEQLLLRTRYRPSQNLQLNATTGVEYRQIEGVADQTNAVFSAGGSYQPVEGTLLHIQTYRRSQTSPARGGWSYMATGLDLRWHQRFLQRYHFGLSGGYQWADYNVDATTGSEREDDILYLRPSLGFDLTKSLSAELGAEYRENSSSAESHSFAEASAYLQVNVLF